MRILKNFAVLLAEARREVPAGTAIEIWFQDEARVGQKNTLVRQWARRGTRPRQPKDQRYASCYIFGAVCPQRDEGAAIVASHADAEVMQIHLEEISRHVRPGAHGVVVLDGAGWHKARSLKVPDNLSLLFLPPYAPELNPVENIWQYLRQRWLANRVFDGIEDIFDACCEAWNALLAEKGRIASIASRKWAVTGQ